MQLEEGEEEETANKIDDLESRAFEEESEESEELEENQDIQ